MSDLADDFEALGVKLQAAVAATADPEQKESGAGAASLARTRRLLGDEASVDRAGDLRGDYDLLGDCLADAVGSGASAVATERKMIRRELAKLEAPEGNPLVTQLESFRAARTAGARAPRRRRKSG